MDGDYVPISIFLLVGAVVSVWTGKLTVSAAITGIIAGVMIYAGAGFTGITMITIFFVTATIATNFKMEQKQSMGLAEKEKGKRNAAQVVANAGVAALLGLLVIAMKDQNEILRTMMAASIAAATSDTLSSETGNIYGKKFYNIITLKKDRRGLNGVISLEGSLIGLSGSIIIATIYYLGFGSMTQFFLIIIAGTCGNLCDSILGATLERKGHLNNNAVNLLNTGAGALMALFGYQLI